MAGISRRELVRSGIAAAVAGAVAKSARAQNQPQQAGQEQPPRTEPQQTATKAFELDEFTFGNLQDSMASGRFTSRALVEKYLARIEELDRKGPQLRAVLEVNPDALALADALDQERKAKGARGPLHGVPILLKDNVDTQDRMLTTAGSLALEGTRPARDATVAARLRQAGAVLLGKANMSEWANFRSSHSSSGWSARGGQARNPYALDRSPSGSSSGSAIAVAANLCAAAIGTETDGSITSPGSACGIVGIKPTVGLVSRAGIIPIAHSQDTAGPMTRSVADAAALLAAIAGADVRDPATTASSGRSFDYLRALDRGALKGARIGVPRKRYTEYSAHADRIAEEAIRVLKEQGAVVIDPADIVGNPGDAELEVLLHEFKADLNTYLIGLPPPAPRTLAELIEFNERNRERELTVFGQELFAQAQKKGPLTSPAYRKALAKCRKEARTRGIDATIRKHRLDALFAPTSGPAWIIDHVNGDAFSGSITDVPAVAGYPHITVPAGFASGLPVGVSFVGPAFSEAKLIGYAYAFEQAIRARRVPRFAARAEEPQAGRAAR